MVCVNEGKQIDTVGPFCKSLDSVFATLGNNDVSESDMEMALSGKTMRRTRVCQSSE